MHRLYGLAALVASLTILANGFAQQPPISTSSINSALSRKYHEPRKIEETAKETFFAPRDRKSLATIRKDELKKITTTPSKTSISSVETLYTRVTRVPTPISLISIYSVTSAKSSNPTRDQNLAEIYIKLPKSELTTESHNRRNLGEIKDSNLLQSSNLVISREENYAKEPLTVSKTNFPKALHPISKVPGKFDQPAVQISSQEKKKLTILHAPGNGNGEVFTNASDYYLTSERSSFDPFTEKNHNIDSRQTLLSSRFNPTNADQSTTTIKKFTHLNFPSFVTTDSTTPNSRVTTVNAALNKQAQDGESSSNFSEMVNRSSEVSLPKMVNKEATIGEVSNLFVKENKFPTNVQSKMGLPTFRKDLNQESEENLKSELKFKNPFVLALIKPMKKNMEKYTLSVTPNSIENKLCKGACSDNKIEIKEKKGVTNMLPSASPEIISEEIGPSFAKDEKTTLPQTRKEGSIIHELCKVSSSQKNLVKSVFSGKQSTSVSFEPNRDLSLLMEASKIKDFRNKDFNDDFIKKEPETSISGSLNVASSLQLDLNRTQVFGEITQKARGNEVEYDTLKDVSGIIKIEPSSMISKGKLNYSHGKAKGSQELKSLPTWTDNATQNLLKDQLEFAGTEEATPVVPEEYLQLKRNKGRRFVGIIFSNSSNDHRNENRVEVGSDPNFILSQIRNYALVKEESNLEDGIVKRNSSAVTEPLSGISDSVDGYYNFINQKSSVDQILKSNGNMKINETMNINGTININEALNINKISKINQTADYFNETLIDEESGENSTKVSTPVNLWPVKHSAVVEGDLVLGGLMMVHEREDTITCGPVMPQGGVQALEAMLYTLDRLNDQEILPGVKIGAHILDDCDKDTYGLEMAVDFIKGSISNIDGAEYHCNKTTVRKVISGVVGAASSVTSIQVANLLRLFRIPQVSFFSTSPELSNKQRFEYFTRTIPSDHYQVKAMVDIVRKMRWSYVSIIYEESNYGIKAFEELEDLLAKYQICIAIKEKLVKDSGVAEETAYDNIVQKLLTKPRARGCIIFGSDQEVAGVMRAVRRCNATGAFSWIGSDGWSARGLVSNGNEPEVEGTLSVQPQANPVKGFEEYFLNLTVENNKRNPWFVEFWEDHFQCRYPNASLTPYNEKYTQPCTTKERLTKQNTAFEDQLQFVSDAVMAFAYAFRNMHKKLCHGKKGLCDAMRPTKGTELLQYLRNVEFEGLSGDEFKFDINGDGPARYNIIHFKQTSPGVYNWIRVGKYLDGKLLLNMSEVQFKLGHPQPPESVCSLPCEDGQAKKYVEGERCCWHCFNCTQYQIRDPDDETQCVMCPQGTVPDESHSYCRDIPEEFLRPESGWAIGAMSFSASGISMTLFVVGVFLKFNDTPVVRASGRELSYILLSGILLCYLVTFTLILKPTNIVCGIQRFTAGFCFTVVYAALLTKTNRISRIFNVNKHSAKRPSFISPKSQLIICAGLVSVQILINGVWMIIDPARAMHHYPTREDNLLVCNSYIDASYMIAFTYPIILIVICTVYAVLTRKIPEAFNESKHIGFTMYTTCVIWLAFVPLYFGTGNHVALRITSMSITISLSASVTIACLFSPKLYIILIRPERNVRQSMMPNRHNTTKSSGLTNASNLMAPVTLTAVTCDQNKAVKKDVITTTDCSTQSENYEMESMNKKNGKPPPALVSRSTQTLAKNNEGDSNSITSVVSKEANKDSKENSIPTKELNTRIGNGPISQNDIPL